MLDLPDTLIEELAQADRKAWHSIFPYEVVGWDDVNEKDREAYRKSSLAVVERFLEYVNEQ